MTDRDDILRRVRAANPVQSDRELPHHLASSRPPLAVLVDRDDAAPIAGKLSPRTATWRRGPLVAAAALVVALAVAVPLLLIGGDGQQAADGVTTPTTAPGPETSLPADTTVPPATTTVEEPAATVTGPIGISEWSYPAEAVPPFHATITFDRNPDSEWAIGYRGSTATVDVWYESPYRFRWQLVELDADLVAQGVPGAGEHMGGEGSYLVADGEIMGLYAANGPDWGEMGEARHYLSWMFWEPADEAAPTDWAAACGENSELLPPTTVAGRDAEHIACSTTRGDWELWLDAETGLILKLEGETQIDDYRLGTSPAGGFEVTSIEYLEGAVPGEDALFSAAPPDDVVVGQPIDLTGIPPLHVTVTQSIFPDPGYAPGTDPTTASSTEEIWFREPDTWRRDTLESTNPELQAGAYEIAADGRLVVFQPEGAGGYTNAYWIEEEAFSGAPLDWMVGADDWIDAEACSDLGIESVAGRPARHDRCLLENSTYDRWTDLQTGLKLRFVNRFDNGTATSEHSLTVTALEIEPDFPDGIFTFTPEPGWCDLRDIDSCGRGAWDGTLLSGGMEVPTFTGPLTDGSTLDFAELRGRPVIVFFWMDAFSPGLLEGLLADFETLYQQWGDRVAFVSVPEMDDVDARRFVERFPLTHAVLGCYADQIPDGADTNILCFPDSPAYSWGTGWPVWVMVDAEGRAADLRFGGDTTLEELDAMIAAVVGGS